MQEFNTNGFQCMLCVTFPDGTSGKIIFLEFINSKYEERYLCSTIPITKVFTKDSGQIYMWLVFSYEGEDSLFHYLPTNKIAFDILESSSGDSFIDPDETTNPLAELAQKVNALENSKISTVEVKDDTVIFYSDLNRENIAGTIKLPSDGDVTWTIMEGSNNG